MVSETPDSLLLVVTRNKEAHWCGRNLKTLNCYKNLIFILIILSSIHDGTQHMVLHSLNLYWMNKGINGNVFHFKHQSQVHQDWCSVLKKWKWSYLTASFKTSITLGLFRWIVWLSYQNKPLWYVMLVSLFYIRRWRQSKAQGLTVSKRQTQA